jgi:anaerobic C4-dicarboxylate transporter
MVSGTAYLQLLNIVLQTTLTAAIFKAMTRTYRSVSKEDQFYRRMTAPKLRQMHTC